jgi:hypothetical protein
MAIFAAISPETPLIGYSEHGCQRAGAEEYGGMRHFGCAVKLSNQSSSLALPWNALYVYYSRV